MKHLQLVVLAVSVALVGACSGGGQEKNGDTVWKAQTDTLEKAKQVGQTMQKDANRQRKAIEQQTQ
ncbi:MAG: hypothetical protein WB783_16810 [Arenicellales bacterium]